MDKVEIVQNLLKTAPCPGTRTRFRSLGVEPALD